MNRRSMIAAAAALGALFAAPAALADEWRPTQPMTMVIGFAAGGSTDIQGRVLARVMEEHFGQPVNVVNQPGAGSAVALTRLKSTNPDGHVFMFGVQLGLTFSPIVTPVEYEIDDFRYAASLIGAQNAFVTGGDQPFQSFGDVIEHARTNAMTYATQHPMDQAIIEAVARQEGGIELAVVPTGGGGGMAPLVLGNEVDFAFSGGTHAQYTETGQMRVLAFLTRERSPFYPDVPTLVELGYDYAMEDFRSFILPAGASDAVVAAFEAAARHAVEHPDFISVTVDNTLHPVVFMDHAETEARIRTIRANNEALMSN